MLTYLRAYIAWFVVHHTGPHRLAKSKRYARSESILASKQRAERAGLRGINT